MKSLKKWLCVEQSMPRWAWIITGILTVYGSEAIDRFIDWFIDWCFDRLDKNR